MKAKNLSLLIGISILFNCLWGCSTGPKNKLETKKIHVVPENISLEPLLNNTSYTLLETKQQNLISKIKKLLVHNDNYYLLDASGKQVLVFDRLGRFLHQLNREGKGPGEYLSIDDFSIDRENEMLVVLSAHQNKLFLYETTTFNHVRTVSYPDALLPTDLECLSNNTYALAKNHVGFEEPFNHFNLSIINAEGRVIKETAPFSPALRNVLYSNRPFFRFKDQVYFANPANRSVYALNNKDTIIQQTLFDFGNSNIDFPQNQGSKTPQVDFSELVQRMSSLKKILKEHSGIFGPLSYLETDKHLLIECIKEDRDVSIFICKQSQKAICVAPEDKLIMGLPKAYINIISVSPDEKSFIGTVAPYQIKEISRALAEQGISSYGADFDKINKQTAEGDNPILIEFDLKRF